MLWRLKEFEILTVRELYAIMQLRQDVFIVEQNCPFLDADGKDIHCQHLMGWEGAELAAYSRIVPPGRSFDEASVGRVVSSRMFRRQGLGQQLMNKSIEVAAQLGYKVLTIEAQYYLLRFYQSFGFKEFGEIYLEDGIEHVHMKLDLKDIKR